MGDSTPVYADEKFAGGNSAATSGVTVELVALANAQADPSEAGVSDTRDHRDAKQVKAIDDGGPPVTLPEPPVVVPTLPPSGGGSYSQFPTYYFPTGLNGPVIVTPPGQSFVPASHTVRGTISTMFGKTPVFISVAVTGPGAVPGSYTVQFAPGGGRVTANFPPYTSGPLGNNTPLTQGSWELTLR